MAVLVSGHNEDVMNGPPSPTWASEHGSTLDYAQDPHNGTVSQHSATQFTVGVTFPFATTTIYKGVGLAGFDSDGVPTSGTLTGFSFYVGGNLVVSITNFSVPVADFLNFIATDDNAGFLSAIFVGNDTISAEFNTIINGASEPRNFLYGYAGNDTINGSQRGDHLDGGAGNDTLIGNAGPDTLVGGAGNDFFVDAAEDTIVEASGGGIDTVSETGYNYTLAANLENLILLGAAAVSGTGNVLANAITGNTAANTLTGLGGSDALNGGRGADTLSGGLGADTLTGGIGHDTLTGGNAADKFVFNAPLSALHSDTITDFIVAADKIQFENSVFTAIGAAGALNPNAFFAGTNAHDASDRVIYDAATGALYYDGDGDASAQAKILIATLTTHPALTAGDIQII